jgi:imidazolonepropionase-like amidohydrolase
MREELSLRPGRPRQRRLGVPSLLALALACRPGNSAPAPAPFDEATGTLVLEGGMLVNPGAPPIANATVVLRNGRVVCAGPGAECVPPKGSPRLDVRATYVGPGLIDAHVHYSQTGWVDGRPDAIDLRSRYPYDSVIRDLASHPERFHRSNLCSGVTTVFDVGGYPWTYAVARASRAASDAPRVVAAGPLLATIQVDSQMRGQFVYMSDSATVRAAVREHKRQGAEALKVWYIEVPDSVQPHAKAMLMVAAAEARKAGLRLIVHATELATAKDALEAGAAVLVHDVFTGTIDDELLGAAKRNHTIVIPTLTVLEGYADVFAGRSPGLRYPLDCVDSGTRQRLEIVLPESLRAKGEAFWGGPEAKRLRDTGAENLRRLYQAGIPIAMGTDAGNPGTAHGPSVYREMEAMQQAGMPAGAVFAAATIVSARAMALDGEIGSIAPGKRADLVVFEADPTADARNARRIRFVIRNGKLYRQQQLLP